MTTAGSQSGSYEDSDEPEDLNAAGAMGGSGRPPGIRLPGLKRVRARRRYTLDRLAEASGIHRVTISSLENLKRGADLKTVYALAEALEVSEDELTGE